MQEHTLIVGIDVMPVTSPSVAMQVNLHVARHRPIFSELQDRPAKIGPGFAIPESWMQHPQTPAIRRVEIVPPKALVPPDGLEQSFRWFIGIGVFVECSEGPGGCTPGRVDVTDEFDHLATVVPRSTRKVKRSLTGRGL